jgi:hypothetical protein
VGLWEQRGVEISDQMRRSTYGWRGGEIWAEEVTSGWSGGRTVEEASARR